MASGKEESKLSSKQVEDIRRAFIYLDKQRTGQIASEDMFKLMRIIGQNPTQQEEKEIFVKYLSDSTGYDIDQVIEKVERIGLKSNEEVYDELVIAFKAIDADGDGCITKEELVRYMRSMGDLLSQDEVDEMMELADMDGNGVIDWNEFATVLCQHIM